MQLSLIFLSIFLFQCTHKLGELMPETCQLGLANLCNAARSDAIAWVTCRERVQDFTLLDFGVLGWNIWHTLPKRSIPLGPVSKDI